MAHKTDRTSWALPWALFGTLVVVVIQVALVWKGYARPWLSMIRRFGTIASFEREQIMYIGFNEAKYVRFLNAYIPGKAPVVLPDQQNAKFTTQNVMQYYLFPRPIWDCSDRTSASCLNYAHNPASFLLAMGDFPPQQLASDKVYIPFPEPYNQINGVYAPADIAQQLAVPTPATYDRLSSIPFKALWIETGVLLLLLLLGSVLISTVCPQPSWLTLLGLGVPAAMGSLTWLIFLTSYMGIPITPASVAAWYLLLLAIGFVLLRLLHRPWGWQAVQAAGRSIRSLLREDRTALILVIALALWCGLAGLISVGRAYTVFDEIANWYLKGFAMVNEHTIWAGKSWGGHQLAYPLNIQLSTALFQLADGDQLPGSKTLFPILAFALLTGCYRFLRRFRVDRKYALVALLLISSVPLFFQHATIGIANLPMTAYLVLGVLWTFDGLWNQSTEGVALGGFLLAFAAWTRPEGIGFSLVMLIGLYCTVLIGGQRTWHWKDVLASLLPILVIPGSWLILVGEGEMRADQVGNDTGAFLTNILHGHFLIGSIGQIASFGLKYFTTWTSAGFLVPLCLLLWLVMWVSRRRKDGQLSARLMILTGIAWAFPMGMFYVASYAETRFQAFLDQSFDRALLPAIVLLAVSAFVSFDRSGRQIAPAAADGETP